MNTQASTDPGTTSTARTLDICDPGALGLAAFALTTFMLSVFNAGLIDKALEPVVFPVALVYGGIVQILAGMWEVVRKNLFGAVAFTSFGAFWIAFSQVATLGLGATAVALFLLAWTIFTAYMTIVTVRINVGLLITFSILLVTFVFLTIGAFSGATIFTTIGGFLGLATAASAWYCSFAGVINTTWGRTVLPNRSLS